MSKNALIIFLRAPEIGKVKSRLAGTVGDKKALEIYQRLISITLEQASHVDCEKHLYFYPHIDHSLVHDGWHATTQQGTDLGQKMNYAFESVLKHHEKAVIIGTDCPYINASIVEEAFTKLDEYDLVIGPAEDGGYYLLGLKQVRPEIFDGIAWSTSEVMRQTIAAAQALHWSAHSLETLSDIDFEADWKAYLSTIP